MKKIKAPNLTELIHVFLNNRFTKNNVLINIHNQLCQYRGIYPHNKIYEIAELDDYFKEISTEKLIHDYQTGIGDIDSAQYWMINEKNNNVIDFFMSTDALIKNSIINTWEIANALNILRDAELCEKIPYLMEFIKSTLAIYGKHDNVEYIF